MQPQTSALPTSARRPDVPRAPAQVATAHLRRINSAELFVAGNEVLIDHADSVYRLRITSLGKLILTK